MKMKTDRSLLKLILLSLISFGIYGLWFLHDVSKDINDICKEDGRQTAGLLQYIIFTVLTLGIYAYVWYYRLAGRIENYCHRHDIPTDLSAKTIAVIFVVGVLAASMGGSLIMLFAYYIIIKNLNVICARYNHLQTAGADTATEPTHTPADEQDEEPTAEALPEPEPVYEEYTDVTKE